jgi:hypothetical protein
LELRGFGGIGWCGSGVSVNIARQKNGENVRSDIPVWGINTAGNILLGSVALSCISTTKFSPNCIFMAVKLIVIPRNEDRCKAGVLTPCRQKETKTP